MKTRYLSVFVVVCVATAVVFSNTCTDTSRLPQLLHNTTLAVATFLTKANYTLMKCAKECLLRSYCRSFNFYLTSSNCQLNSLNSTEATGRDFVSAVNGVFSDIDMWPGRLSSGCQNHTCDINQRCSDINGTAVCEDVGCLKPDPIHKATIFTLKRLVWNFGEELLYVCHSPYVQKGDLICQTNGLWSFAKCRKE